MMIRPSSAKSSATKKRRRRSNCCATKTCATKWAVLLEVLDDRERKIIFSRFGLDGGKPKTLEEVGKKFGVTRERIRQLQNIALVEIASRPGEKRAADRHRSRDAGRGVKAY